MEDLLQILCFLQLPSSCHDDKSS
ncbi:hypothetical protein L195_g045427, partial [Trifolium pratense]